VYAGRIGGHNERQRQQKHNVRQSFRAVEPKSVVVPERERLNQPEVNQKQKPMIYHLRFNIVSHSLC
jgi:hypothetical protein